MGETIVRSERPVTLVGASALAAGELALALAHAPLVVAADGGAASVLAHGLDPLAVIGDLDSVPPEVLARIPPERIHRLDEQETTDFDKCLRSVASPLVLGVGFLGARIDHQLAAMSVLVRRLARPCILIGGHDIVFAAPPRLSLDVPAGTRVSLFPLAPVAGHSTGLRWPIAGLSFRPDGRIGTSNAATGPVTLDLPEPGMLVVLPRETLSVAVAALAPDVAGGQSAPRTPEADPL